MSDTFEFYPIGTLVEASVFISPEKLMEVVNRKARIGFHHSYGPEYAFNTFHIDGQIPMKVKGRFLGISNNSELVILLGEEEIPTQIVESVQNGLPISNHNRIIHCPAHNVNSHSVMKEKFNSKIKETHYGNIIESLLNEEEYELEEMTKIAFFKKYEKDLGFTYEEFLEESNKYIEFVTPHPVYLK